MLTYDILSYLTYEGVNICESLEIESRQENTDLKPFLRRQHLVVTAIKEFIQATETYGKMPHLSSEDKEFLKNLQSKYECKLWNKKEKCEQERYKQKMEIIANLTLFSEFLVLLQKLFLGVEIEDMEYLDGKQWVEERIEGVHNVNQQ